jgi:hypothetical protein
LPGLIENNLIALSMANRTRVSAAVATLYQFRLVADYVAASTIDERDARIAASQMQVAFRILSVIP